MPNQRPLQAVTVDGYGTLLRLADPIGLLQAALRERGLDVEAPTITRAFAAEVDHYRPRSHTARDEQSLAALRHECVGVFLRELGADIQTEEFVDPFVAALVFEPIDGAADALRAMRHLGLKLACVANWDIGLHAELDTLGLAERFDLIHTSAEAGAPKPARLIFDQALSALGVDASAAVHIGDEEVDRLGAAAAGMRFEPVPLATLPARLAPWAAS